MFVRDSLLLSSSWARKIVSYVEMGNVKDIWSTGNIARHGPTTTKTVTQISEAEDGKGPLAWLMTQENLIP